MLWIMSGVTHILSAIEQGDPHAAEHLLPLVYDELRKLAAARLANELKRRARPEIIEGARQSAHLFY
jgi:hypothetical protein